MPPLALKVINTGTWGSSANTCTITDAYIKANSQVEVWVTGTTPAAGQWSYTVTPGQCIITSNNAESSSLPLSYIIF